MTDQGRLAGKALITAAGQGIGRATALAMAAEGASVFAPTSISKHSPALMARAASPFFRWTCLIVTGDRRGCQGDTGRSVQLRRICASRHHS